MSTARDDVITVLADIASQDRHYDWYLKAGKQGKLADDLWRYWMRDAYLPHSRDFQRDFSQAEQDKLELFTRFFEDRLKQLPARFESLMVDVHWAAIREYAAVVLEQLAESPDDSAATA